MANGIISTGPNADVKEFQMFADGIESTKEFIATLPAAAQAHFQHFEERDLDAGGKRHVIHEKLNGNREARDRLTNEMWHLARDYEARGTKPAKVITDPVTGDSQGPYRAKIAALKGEDNHLHAMMAELPQSVVTTILEDLRRYRNEPLRMAGVIEPTRKKGEDWPAAVDRLSDTIDAALKVEKSHQLAKRTLAEVEVMLDVQIPQIIARGRPNIRKLFAGGHVSHHRNEFRASNPNTKLEFPLRNLGMLKPNAEPLTSHDMAFVAWLFPDQFNVRIRELAAEFADDVRAIPEAEKPAILAEDDAAILQAERAYEAACRAAEASGIRIERRTYRYPALVLLGLEIGDSNEAANEDLFDGEDP
jgi:hypothetical protein